MVTDPVILGSAALNGSRATVANTPPLMLARTERNFIPAILQGLATDRQGLASTQAATRDANGILKLFQPVHQMFHVALVQIACDTFGTPRLDPAKIDSAGLVIRRVPIDNSGVLDNSGVMERWSKAEDSIQGWVPCSDNDLDPDPARRRPKASSGHPEIDSRLPIPSPAYAPFSETFTPLFVAPPDMCKAAQATVLYGLIPVTSVEKSEAPPSPAYDINLVQNHMPYFLVPGGSQTISSPKPVLSWADVNDDPGQDPGTLAIVEQNIQQLAPFLTILRQLEFEFGAFSGTPEGTAILQALNRFNVQDEAGNDLGNLGDFLQQASQILIDRQDGSVQMPPQWPDIGDQQSAAIARLIQTALESRAGKMVAGVGRYEDTTVVSSDGSYKVVVRQYRLRAFVRVKRSDGCPPALVWTAPSEPFVIAPWYDNAGLPPVKINLPDVNRDFLKNLKPNVSFAMPENLFNQLQRDAKSVVQGKSSTPGGSSLGVGWLCSFSIPIITICAFIVLNIFLSLFDLFFSWLLFIKICIPIPIPKRQ